MLKLDRVGPKTWHIHYKLNLKKTHTSWWKNKRKLTMELFNISLTFMKIIMFPECKFPEDRNYIPLVHSGVP